MNKRLTLIVTVASMAMPIHAASVAAATPPAGGTIAIQPKTADGDYDASMTLFVDATANALATRGFTILDDPDHAAYVAELTLSRVEVGTGRARVAGGNAVVPNGIGVAIPLSSGKSDLVPLRRTRLELRLRKRGETGSVWDGAAVTVRGAAAATGTDRAVAADLAGAILQPYPAQPKGVIGVP